MSYPDAKYLGENGEVTARYWGLRHSSPTSLYPNGTRCSYVASGKTTNGLFGIYLWEMATEPSGPGPHFHRSFTELFYVLSGTIRVYDGREWVDTQRGDFLHIP